MEAKLRCPREVRISAESRLYLGEFLGGFLGEFCAGLPHRDQQEADGRDSSISVVPIRDAHRHGAPRNRREIRREIAESASE